MPRTKEVTVNEKKFVIHEMRVSKLRNDVIPTVMQIFQNTEDLGKMSIQDVVDKVFDYIPNIIPEIPREDIENAYMSELEDLIKAWLEVNFSGLSRAGAFLGSLTATVSRK